MDKLTLEHLAPYLPYGLKIQVMREDGSLDIITLNASKVILIVDGYYCGTEKLILRPLSEVTKEIVHNEEKIVPKEVLVDRYDLKFDEDDDFFLDYYCIGETDSPWTGYHIIQLLIQWHFDVFGLIEKGLAISTDTLVKEVKR